LTLSQFSYANTGYRFKTLTTADGLPSNQVFKVFQQSNGLVWFGTDQGVSRYDGFQFKHYRYAPGHAYHISNNQVTDILEDKNGNIWISTEAGLNKIGPDGVITIFQDDPNLPNYLAEIWLLSLFEDSGGNLWLGTGVDLKRYDPVSNSFVTYDLSLPNQSTHKTSVYKIVETSLNQLYLATSDGLAIINYDTKSFSLLTEVNRKLIGGDGTHLLKVLKDDTLVLGTEKSGVILYDTSTSSIRQLLYQNDGRGLSENNISSLSCDQKGNIWIGHGSLGISIYDGQHSTFSYIQTEEFAPYSLPDGSINSLLIDRSGLYWIATSEGVALHSELHTGSRIYRKRPDKSELSGNYIYDLHADSEDHIWLATENGIDRINTLTGNVITYPLTDLNGKRYVEQLVYKISAAPNNQLWLGTHVGLKLFDPKTGLVRGFQDHLSLPNYPIYTLLPVSNGSVWLTGYIDVGLILFSQEEGVTKAYLNDNDSKYFVGGNYTNSKIASSIGDLWLATTDGLFRVDHQSGQVNHYALGEHKQSVRATSIIENQDSTFWVTTAGEGLLKVKPSDEGNEQLDIVYVTKRHRLGQDELRSALVDGDTLWLTSRTELIKFNWKDETWQSFPNLLGIEQLVFLEDAILKVGNMLHIGSSRGLVSIDTTKLKSNEFDAPIQITGVKAGGRKLLKHLDSRLAPVFSLAYEDNHLEIAFAALDFTNPKSNQYQYKLEGTDEDWVSTSKNKVVHYNSLSAGHHVFRVRGTNSDGRWSSQEASFSFSVQRPWWFFVISGLVCILLLLTLKFALNRGRYMRFLHEKAHIDTLTNVANRYSFNSQLTQHIDSKSRFALVLLDIDNFKEVNDSYGHHVGDLFLIEAGKRIQSCIRKSDTLGRIGGDEFAIIVTRFQELTALYEMIERIRMNLNQNYLLEQHNIASSSSIGVALYPVDAIDSRTLLSYADAAMYQAKKSGRNNVFMFNASLSQALNKKLKIRTNLQQALGNAELYLLYQPKVNQFTGKMVGVEALIRWQHILEGDISPNEFIPEAESNGTICTIGNWVIETACLQAQHWEHFDIEGFKVSINISAVQLFQVDFVENIKSILTKTGVNPRCIELEITETMLIGNFEQCKSKLTKLQSLGVTVAIDDFGVGFSSFSYLTQFTFDTLKIDRSFVQALKPNNLNYKVLKNIYQLAKDLELEVVAEGVEHEAQLAVLAQLNGAIIQGHYFSKAVDANVIANLLNHQCLGGGAICTLFSQGE
jgi:diguanylate cyclase (GGDEF)-like protein